MDRIDPQSGLPINCMDCKHIDADTLYTCTAYPDGIPVPILSGDIQHDQPLPNDKGIQFEVVSVRAQKLDSKSAAIVRLISDYYNAPVDALLGVPRIDSNTVSGLFRSGYTVVAYRFDSTFLSWDAWEENQSLSFLRGYYVPELSPYLPTSYAMGLVDAAIAKDKRSDAHTSTNNSNLPLLAKSTVLLTAQSRELANEIQSKHKAKI